eukprot:NODE_830_length_3850_cov_0.215143.p1 type:complete len:447 gc:universal NODE_830_length_3850_cov_0.215143:564-1904(+)
MEQISNIKEMSVVVLGSGYVVEPCVRYLHKSSYNVKIISRTIKPHLKKYGECISHDLVNLQGLKKHLKDCDIIVSLVPYTLHAEIIKVAIELKKHIVTTSYINPEMAELDQKCKDNGIISMNEIGMDPGIDHLYAIDAIDYIRQNNGKIDHFTSFCGGLPAPEFSDNPLGYKFSWSARGVLLALKNTAKYYENNELVEVSGKELMKSAKPVETPYPSFRLVGYGNRDSSIYKDRYHISEAQTCVRGTMRYWTFPIVMDALHEIGLLSTDEISVNAKTWKELMQHVFSTKESDLMPILIKKSKIQSAENLKVFTDAINWLGLLEDLELPTVSPKTLLDYLTKLFQSKMEYQKGERDMVFLIHKFDVSYPSGKKERRFYTLIDYGTEEATSMAKLVGVPCAVAVEMILRKEITQTGVFAPLTVDLARPMMKKLESLGIKMKEHVIELD